MNEVYVEAFTIQKFNQDGNEGATMIVKLYNPSNLIFHHSPVKEKVGQVEINQLRNGYLVDTLTSVDNQENIKIGGKVIEIHEGVSYEGNFKISPFRKS